MEDHNAGTVGIDRDTRVACDVASGRAKPDMEASPVRVLAASKDLNCKGRGPIKYRRVYRDGSWGWVSDEKLPRGSFRASERRAEVWGDAYPGDLVACYDAGVSSSGYEPPKLERIYLLIGEDENGKTRRVDCEFAKRRDGQVSVTLPDGNKMVVASPDWR